MNANQDANKDADEKTQLFSPIQFRDLKIKNRVFMSPMCQYSATDGVPNDWHLTHLSSRAVGGCGLIVVEATSINPEGRISPEDLGIWNETQVAAFRPITNALVRQGAVPGIQIAHAGRKASTAAPWKGGGPVKPSEGGWETLAPSAIPFTTDHPTPREMTREEIEKTLEDFASAARLSLNAGFQVIELHMAHGYLMHQFLSPLSNQRKDEFGGSLENRMRFPLHVAEKVRGIWPAKWPLFVRISATDWAEGGWDLPQSIEFCRALQEIGVDLIDCSSGGLVSHAKIPVSPGYQVPFAREIRKEVKIATGAVGLITDPLQAESILKNNEADAIFLARELLRRPYWALHAAKVLGADVPWPQQYERAKPR